MDRLVKLKEFLEKNPGDSFLRHALALEYIRIGDEVNARKMFEEVLKDDPAYVGSYYHLAKLLERMGEREAAIDIYEKGMEASKKSNDSHSYNELKTAYDELVY
jgi:Tfp pilus assembly protein PilF